MPAPSAACSRSQSRSPSAAIIGCASAISFSGLVQTHQVSDERVQVAIFSCIAGIKTAGLDGVRPFHPQPQILLIVWSAPEAIVVRLIKCVRSGPKRPLQAFPRWCGSSCRHSSQNFAPASTFGDTQPGSSAPAPSAQIFLRLHDHRQQHLACCVPQYARTVRHSSYLVRLDPHFVPSIRDEVGLARSCGTQKL